METKSFSGHADIIDGPSKFDLMLALFDGYQNNEGVRSIRRVVFVTNLGQPVRAQITSCAIEDGSNESWLISGNFVPVADPSVAFSFSGYYSTRRRKGYLQGPNQVG